MDTNGRIYAGASDDLGYLALGKNGKPQFVSLLSHLPSQYHQFGDVLKPLPRQKGSIFLPTSICSVGRVIVFSNGKQ